MVVGGAQITRKLYYFIMNAPLFKHLTLLVADQSHCIIDYEIDFKEQHDVFVLLHNITLVRLMRLASVSVITPPRMIINT